LISEPDALVNAMWETSTLLDSLGLYTTEVYQQARESVIARQQEELIELSTPVVELWQGILALPLLGPLDSERTQVVMGFAPSPGRSKAGWPLHSKRTRPTRIVDSSRVVLIDLSSSLEIANSCISRGFARARPYPACNAHPTLIAAILCREFSRRRDDVTVLVGPLLRNDCRFASPTDPDLDSVLEGRHRSSSGMGPRINGTRCLLDHARCAPIPTAQRRARTRPCRR
jgi:hypothetical protein